MERWIASHGVSDKDAETRETGDEDKSARIREVERLRRLKPQASLDLHGRTAVEAEALLTEFIASSSRAGLDKVLVIHGKGIHSSSEPILYDLVRSVLERSDLAGSFGPADKESGGRGATWVLIRKKIYFSR
jgi:DNA-nicking Smr family endonuclease